MKYIFVVFLPGRSHCRQAYCSLYTYLTLPSIYKDVAIININLGKLASLVQVCVGTFSPPVNNTYIHLHHVIHYSVTYVGNYKIVLVN